MAVSDERYSATEIAAMDQYEIGKHMSGGYGPGKLLKMFLSIQDMAALCKPVPFDPKDHNRHRS